MLCIRVFGIYEQIETGILSYIAIFINCQQGHLRDVGMFRTYCLFSSNYIFGERKLRKGEVSAPPLQISICGLINS